ncbi:MAG: GTPase HflX [Dehalococcoidia bacterium]|nr:GTPase HflX [Dehalococcoidia bacterium]
MLVGVEVKGRRGVLSQEDSLEELAQLARTAGARVVAVVAQHVAHLTSVYMGRGKLDEMVASQAVTPYDVAIFDDELTPVQQENLETALNVKVIDRTALILDIFARRAQTQEARLQVELAQHQYLLPRLAGQWSHLERLGGGIGTRGPGESQLETDRRLVRKRIQRLTERLDDVRMHREHYRERRRSQGVPVVSLVGYTNAGKSTLMNALSRADVLVEDKPFATLDPVTRRIMLPNGGPALLTDTVGFIQKLPHSVVAAFRATLEEIGEADLLLHVVDITHKNAAEQAQVVDKILAGMGLMDRSRILVLNKVDVLAPDTPEGMEPGVALESLVEAPRETRWPVALVSAAKGWGLDRLREMIARELEKAAKDSKAAVAGDSSLRSE